MSGGLGQMVEQTEWPSATNILGIQTRVIRVSKVCTYSILHISHDKKLWHILFCK